MAKGEAAVGRIMDIFEDYLAERHHHPQDDFLTDLVRTARRPRGAAGRRGQRLFLLSNAFGNTPTLVAGTIGLLLDNPEVAAAMQRGELTLDQVTEEGARLLTPITYALSAGDTDDDEWETHYLAAANRDAQEFAAPDVFDPARVPNRHLTFLVGPHACLGASVAKLITGVVAEQTLRRLPGLRRSRPPTWSAAAPLHRLAHLPVAWDV
ncbi:hypothetical protein [Nocardioides sp.]|uniref:hypothetical protein n=1 Tax=Nocardioides sp. TaxID=35761 RepID=UPI003529B8B4